MINRWFNIDTIALRTMFGFTVNYIDWFDFMVHWFEIPYPDINDLLNLKTQYMLLERKKKYSMNGIYHIILTIWAINIFYFHFQVS